MILKITNDDAPMIPLTWVPEVQTQLFWNLICHDKDGENEAEHQILSSPRIGLESQYHDVAKTKQTCFLIEITKKIDVIHHFWFWCGLVMGQKLVKCLQHVIHNFLIFLLCSICKPIYCLNLFSISNHGNYLCTGIEKGVHHRVVVIQVLIWFCWFKNFSPEGFIKMT